MFIIHPVIYKTVKIAVRLTIMEFQLTWQKAYTQLSAVKGDE